MCEEIKKIIDEYQEVRILDYGCELVKGCPEFNKLIIDGNSFTKQMLIVDGYEIHSTHNCTKCYIEIWVK